MSDFSLGSRLTGNIQKLRVHPLKSGFPFLTFRDIAVDSGQSDDPPRLVPQGDLGRLGPAVVARREIQTGLLAVVGRPLSQKGFRWVAHPCGLRRFIAALVSVGWTCPRGFVGRGLRRRCGKVVVLHR